MGADGLDGLLTFFPPFLPRLLRFFFEDSVASETAFCLLSWATTGS